ncbi:MAG: DNRLRE domain-containing protein [Promethearchaeota archaeon]
MKEKKIFIIGIFLAILIVTILIKPSTAQKTPASKTISTIADKDSYVDSGNPTANYGGQEQLRAGFSLSDDIYEAYFHFNFSDKPSNYTKVEISLNIWSVDKMINLTICLIEANWDEYSMNWTNKPDKGPVITYLLLSTSEIYKFDVSNYIQGRDNISICAYIDTPNYVDDYVLITSREDDPYDDEKLPQLIWTHEKVIGTQDVSPAMLYVGSLLFFLVVFIALIIVGVVFLIGKLINK